MNKLTSRIVTLLTCCILAACSPTDDKAAVDKAEKDLFAIHDALMPQMGDMMKMEKRLKNRINTLDSLQSTRPSDRVRLDEEKQQAQLLNQQLSEADSLMMSWMEHYNGDTLGQLKPDESLRYLESQKNQITDVQTKFNRSLEQARQFLKQ